ncbi:hypothetical protein [Halorubrum vacuolatum]|uniref:Uncharacterized protein n=1 Tax=Halorubrum vacuolatum TaxID=63740 RepID=A0A238VED7_HALVU|nr:hypothetical protein [Halorubrum vacuolatum]SNR31899.1 hypothetical protein SAMN06264855_102240 [Halorubrum vacuolatum]
MSSEESAEGSTAERVIEGLTRLGDRFNELQSRVRSYTPPIVRAIEVVLAVALLAGVTYWAYLFLNA